MHKTDYEHNIHSYITNDILGCSIVSITQCTSSMQDASDYVKYAQRTTTNATRKRRLTSLCRFNHKIHDTLNTIIIYCTQ